MKQFKVLICDKLSEEGMLVFNEKYIVDINTTLSEDEIVSIIGEYDAMIVRSETTVTSKIIEATKKMKVIGRAGVGLDNIDVIAANKKGIIVVNSPEGNTVSAAEHTFGLILSASRNIPFAHNSVQKGQWNRAKFLGTELSGKTLGIIGLGKIGKKVATYAKVFGMKVVANDILLNQKDTKHEDVQLLTFEEVLATSDFLTLHIPRTKETEGMFNKKAFNLMKNGVFFINCSRGGIVVEKDLKDAVECGKVKVAAVDVFLDEPVKPNSVLLGIPNIITTPHIGAATKEAKINVAIDVVEQVCRVLEQSIK